VDCSDTRKTLSTTYIFTNMKYWITDFGNNVSGFYEKQINDGYGFPYAHDSRREGNPKG
jgi:hypothetical protein